MAKKHTVSPGFRDGYSGRLVVDRYEFQGHINGTTDFHKAESVTVKETPALTAIGTPNNVQTALANINSYILGQVGIGQGLITVGDGYDTWRNANGTINYDKTVPSLDTLLNPVFNAIINGTTIPDGFLRIQHGGIIVIKSGTYIIKSIINVPAGIILMGEGDGTKIVNATNLNLTVTPPITNGSGSGTPIFRIKADPNRSVNDGVLDSGLTNLLAFQRQTRITNMVISDNFVENTQLGDTSNYKLPQNKTGLSPLIIQEAGSNFLLDNCMLVGRVIYSTGKVVSSGTTYAVAFDTATTSASGTYLQIKQSIIDGFLQPISFPATAYHRDFLEVSDSKIRVAGYLNADSTGVANNCIVSANGCDTRIVNNHFWGNHINARTILHIAAVDTTTDPQSRAKILVTSNTMVIDKASVGSPAFLATYLNPGANPSKISVLDAWNNFQPSTLMNISNPVSFGADINVAGNLNVTGSLFGTTSMGTSGTSLLGGVLFVRTFSVSSNYTVDSSAGDYILFVNTLSNPVTITLPALSQGRQIIIKDVGGNAQTNNITIARAGGTGTIDGYPGNRVISTNYSSWTLTSDNTSWWIV